MFHSIGLLEFMQREETTDERINLEFLSILDFKLQNKWINGMRYYYGTLIFCLFNQNHNLSVEELGNILRFPIYGPRDVPSEFNVKNFWVDITGGHFYTVVGEKASTIQNHFFLYAQKVLAYTLFGWGDSTDVSIQREIFFLYCMINNDVVNVASFMANYLRRVSRATAEDILVGGLITQIVEHLWLEFN